MKTRFWAMIVVAVTSFTLCVSAQQSILKVKPSNDGTAKKAAPIGNGPAVTSASQNAKALQNIEHESLRASPRQAAPRKAPQATKIAEDRNPPINFGGQGAHKAAVLGGTDPYRGRLRTKDSSNGHN
jgi:hypothetical protein